jgi:multidrug efflux pump subunit AcrB
MWIVRLALRRPYTVAVLCALITLLGFLSARSMLVDVFPVIDIPVVAVVWNYPGMPAEDMERRVVYLSERGISTSVGGVERIESQSIPGLGLLKVYFQPGADIGAAIAQMASVSNTALRIMPPGMTPPVIVQWSASNVPVAQLTASSKTLSEEKIFDYGLNFIRIKLFTIPGLATPAPFGGRQRQVNVDLDLDKLAARGLSPPDIIAALQASNVIVPAGSARMGDREFDVLLNSSPAGVPQFAQIPVKIVAGAPVLLGDVAKVSDGFTDQTNIVRVDGRRATYLSILRKNDASTLAVVDAAKEVLPSILAAAPEGLELKVDFDQSIFVRNAISSVLREAGLASLLVSLMILGFLGSWRSVVLVCTSIPLAILVALTGLKLLGQSLNIMTLSGLSLAIGMLVDDATVEVENIHRNRALGKPLTVAILDGAHQVATPAIVATLSICIVFAPVALLNGPARYLFSPLALSVVIAMMASYFLSRTLVPTLARMLMAGESHDQKPSLATRLREGLFTGLQRLYGGILRVVLRHRPFVLLFSLAILVLTGFLARHVGTDFFPQVDTGLMKLHVRAPAGLRIEGTERLVAQVEKRIRTVVPQAELGTVNAMIGVPISFNLAFVQTDNVSGTDAELLVALRPGHHPTDDYVRELRKVLPREFPGASFYFQPADIVSQVVNFGASSALDVQIEGRDLNATWAIARRLRDKIRAIPGAADVHILQNLESPGFQIDVDRARAAELGLSQKDVATSVLVAMSSSSTVSPSFFVNPQNNVNYAVSVRVPLGVIDSVDKLRSLPLNPPQPSLQPGDPPPPNALPQAPVSTLGAVSHLTPRTGPGQITHYTVQRIIDVAAGVDGRDLGAVATDVDKAVASLGKLPPGIAIHVRGQAEVMRNSFGRLAAGIVLAVLLVYLLMVVLYQTWLDPLVIMTAVPGALVGIVWMLAATGTTINVVSMMGAIMAVGIAVANSILLVSFANEVRAEEHLDATEGAWRAGVTRLRPVIMTAVAMILGMLPMALGSGEAGEQNAPLGRAVIGGLLVATLVTLFVVPVVYSLLRKKAPGAHRMDARFEAEARGETYVEAT